MEKINQEAREYRAKLDRRERLRDSWALVVTVIVVIWLNAANIVPIG